MKGFVCALMIACFAGLVCSDVSASNKFVDQVVTALKADKNFDPLTIKEEYKVHFNRNIGHLHPIHLEGDLKFHSTVVTGLSKVHRIGDAVLDNNGKNGSFSAQLKLGDSNVKAVGFVSVHATHIHPELRVEMDIGDIGVNFAVDLATDGTPHLKSFAISKLTHVRFHVQGLIALDPLIDVLADAYVALFNTQVKDLLSSHLKTVIEAELKHLKLPSY